MGAMKKNTTLKRGLKEKNREFEGGVTKKSLQICTNANTLPECQKPAFLTFRKFKYSWESMPPDPPPYYVPKGNSIPLKWKNA